MCLRQDCDGCPMFSDTLDGMLESDKDSIVEISKVGKLGDALGLERGTKVIIYTTDRDSATVTAPTAREALRLARERVRQA